MPEIDLLGNISLSIIAATAFAILAKALKQPLILAYIAAGVVLGPEMGFGWIQDKEIINIISEIGLILLLFTIGMEIDISKLISAGKSMVVTGISQFLICAALSFGFALLLGFRFGNGNFDALYFAVGISLSSTMIVVKLLYDKFELATLPGRLSLGILIFQDIWAILFLSFQSNLLNPSTQIMLQSFIQGAGLILISLLVSKYLLSRLFSYIAKMPELLLVTALAWCFVVAGVAGIIGLSREMGALIAGISLSAFPYNVDVISKVITLRDFFVTLFFVGLGLQIPFPTGNIIFYASLTALFLIATRFLSIFPALYLLKNGLRASLLPAINLSQVSEFSLVIAALGLGLKHISQELVSILIFSFAITSILSVYLINYNHSIQNRLSDLLKKAGFKDIEDKAEEEELKGEPKKIVFLGFFREASSILAELEKMGSEGKRNPILDEILVIDFNPVVHHELNQRGIKCIYGDISSMETLKHARVDSAKIVISSIDDSILRGTNSQRLMKMIHNLSPKIEVMVASNSIKQAIELYQQGADFVLISRIHSAREIAKIINESLEKGLKSYRDTELKNLMERNEVLG